MRARPLSCASARPLWVLVFLGAAACTVACTGTGPAKKPVVVAPPPVAKVMPPPKLTSPARWHLVAHQGVEVRAAPLSLSGPGGRRLYVTMGGERWMSAAEGLLGAPTLAPGPLVGAMQDGSGFTFLTHRGRTLHASTPFGDLTPIGALGVAPEARVSAAAGKATLLAVAGGVLHRSTDRGATWSKAALPAGPYLATYVAADAHGDGLLLGHPQRLFLTHDDGATWTPVASPGIGAEEVLTDARGKVFLRGHSGVAELDKGALHTAGSIESTLPGAQSLPSLSWGAQWAIEDEVVALLSRASKGFELRLGPMGSLGPPVPAELGDCQQAHLALGAGRVVVACEAGSTTLGTTRILVSDDRGKTFHEEASLPGGHVDSNRLAVFAGPRGFVFVDRRCTWDQKGGRTCVPARVRVAGSEQFVPLTHAGVPLGGSAQKGGFSLDTNIEKLVVDKAKGRYFVVLSSYEATTIYSAGLEESDLVLRASLEGQAHGNGGTAFGIDDAGRLVVARRRGYDGWLVRRMRDDGSEATTHWIPLPFEHLELSGARGIGVTADGRAFETVDGGLHFREVSAPTKVEHNSPFGCSAFGCVIGPRIREGWDEPAAPPGNLVTALPASEVAEPPPPYSSRRPPGAKSVYGTPFQCRLEGPKIPIGRVPVGYVSNVRWTSFVTDGKDAYAFPVVRDDGSVVARVLGKGKKELVARDVTLLGPEPTEDTRTVVTRTEVQQGGVVAMRFSTTKASGSGKTVDPVDVELAFWTSADDKVRKAKVEGHPPFRLPTRWQNDSTVWLDKDGLWFRGGHDGTAPLLFLRGGTAKAEEIPWPKTSDWAPNGYGVVRTKDRLLLFSRTEQNPDGARIWLREGDQWTRRTWSVGLVLPYDGSARWMPNRQPTLQAFPFGGGAAYLSTFWDSAALHAFVAPIGPTADPGPGVLAVPPLATLTDLAACDEGTRGAPRVGLPWAPGARRAVMVQGALDSGEFAASSNETLLRLPTQGSPCGRALAFSRWNSETGIVALDDLKFGLFLRVDTGRDQTSMLRAQRLVCVADKGAKLPSSLEDEEGFWVQ